MEQQFLELLTMNGPLTLLAGGCAIVVSYVSYQFTTLNRRFNEHTERETRRVDALEYKVTELEKLAALNVQSLTHLQKSMAAIVEEMRTIRTELRGDISALTVCLRREQT